MHQVNMRSSLPMRRSAGSASGSATSRRSSKRSACSCSAAPPVTPHTHSSAASCRRRSAGGARGSAAGGWCPVKGRAAPERRRFPGDSGSGAAGARKAPSSAAARWHDSLDPAPVLLWREGDFRFQGFTRETATRVAQARGRRPAARLPGGMTAWTRDWRCHCDKSPHRTTGAAPIYGAGISRAPLPFTLTACTCFKLSMLDIMYSKSGGEALLPVRVGNMCSASRAAQRPRGPPQVRPAAQYTKQGAQLCARQRRRAHAQRRRARRPIVRQAPGTCSWEILGY